MIVWRYKLKRKENATRLGQAGVRFKPARIPACAGMTDRHDAKLPGIFLGQHTRLISAIPGTTLEYIGQPFFELSALQILIYRKMSAT